MPRPTEPEDARELRNTGYRQFAAAAGWREGTFLPPADASTPRVDYPLSLPVGTSVQINEDGSVGGYLNGELLFFVGAPFANDSLGAQIPTHYEYSSGVLTQVLDLTSSDIAFPVIADPWMGQALYRNVNVTMYTFSTPHTRRLEG